MNSPLQAAVDAIDALTRRAEAAEAERDRLRDELERERTNAQDALGLAESKAQQYRAALEEVEKVLGEECGFRPGTLCQRLARITSRAFSNTPESETHG